MADPSSIPDVSSLPIVQAAVVIASATIGLLAWLKGEKKRPLPAPDGNYIPATQLFFDGSLVKALEILQNIYRVMNEMKEDNKETIHEFRERHERELDILRNLLTATMKRGR